MEGLADPAALDDDAKRSVVLWESSRWSRYYFWEVSRNGSGQDTHDGLERSRSAKAVAELVKRGTTDPEFRALALRDPAAAIARINPKPLPPGFKVKVVEADGANVTVVLPDLIPVEGELADSQLEQVSGGTLRAQDGNYFRVLGK